MTHAYLKEKGAPLWGLKYCKAMPNGAMRDNLNKIVDNLLRICEPDGMKNPALMIETLELLKNYDKNIKRRSQMKIKKLSIN